MSVNAHGPNLGLGPELRPLPTTGCKYGEQATKGVWWMPRHQEATKGVTNCDKCR